MELNYDSDEEDKAEGILRMLDDMPDLEIEQIELNNADNGVLNRLIDKPMFKSKEDLFKILKFRYDNALPSSEPYEYLSFIDIDSNKDMSNCCKQAGCVSITRCEKDLNINWPTQRLEISSHYIDKIRDLNLGNKEFFDSVNTVQIKLEDESISAYKTTQYVKLTTEHFKNLQSIELRFYESMELEELCKILKNSLVNRLHTGSTSSNYDKVIKSEEGQALICSNKSSCLINFKNLEIYPHFFGILAQDKYVMFSEYEIEGLNFDILDDNTDSKDYADFKTDKIFGPAFVLHKKYIHKLIVKGEFKGVPCFIPQKQMKLEVDLKKHLDTDELIKYVKSGFTGRTHVHIKIDGREGSILRSKFIDLVEDLFKYLNVKQLSVEHLDSKYATSKFYTQIEHCKSLRSVQLVYNRSYSDDLKVLGTNPNVRRWDLSFNSFMLQREEMERLEELILENNENSIV